MKAAFAEKFRLESTRNESREFVLASVLMVLLFISMI